MYRINQLENSHKDHSTINVDVGIIIIRLHHLLHAMHKMRPIATDATCSVVCVSVCVLVTLTYCVKTAEPIEVPFGMLTHVDPRNQQMGVTNG